MTKVCTTRPPECRATLPVQADRHRGPSASRVAVGCCYKRQTSSARQMTDAGLFLCGHLLDECRERIDLGLL